MELKGWSAGNGKTGGRSNRLLGDVGVSRAAVAQILIRIGADGREETTARKQLGYTHTLDSNHEQVRDGLGWAAHQSRLNFDLYLVSHRPVSELVFLTIPCLGQ